VKDDPFATLGGLDQQLYKDQGQDNETTKQRDNGSTPPRQSEGTEARAQGPAEKRASGPARERTQQPTRPLAAPRPPQRLFEAKRTRASARTGHLRMVRSVERHSHDIYADQIRWMNRAKLEILEAYNAKVTGNEMVQLAIEVLRDDFERNGEDSLLFRVLVLGQEPDLGGGEN
jgi:hypothetical protein